jgi:thiamine biosynthesis lipoprotein
MESITLSALGTSWWIELFDAGSQKRREFLEEEIATLLRSIEARFSRFKTDSLVGILNHERQVQTDDHDFDTLIGYGRDMYRKTKGRFNILIGDALVARGYDQDYSLVVQERDIAIGNPLTDIDYHDGAWRLSTGLLDLGGIGKGWAIDKIAELLQNQGVIEFLINGGGDMYGTTEHDKPITIYLEHPTEPNTYIGTTTIMNQGFAASSSHKRRWQTKTGETSHIVGDQELVDASFVIAHDALTADLLATTALLLPEEDFVTLAQDEHIAHTLLNLAENRMITTPNFPFASL